MVNEIDSLAIKYRNPSMALGILPRTVTSLISQGSLRKLVIKPPVHSETVCPLTWPSVPPSLSAFAMDLSNSPVITRLQATSKPSRSR